MPCPHGLHLCSFVLPLLAHLVCVVLVLGASLNCKEFQPSTCLYTKDYRIFWKETLSESCILAYSLCVSIL